MNNTAPPVKKTEQLNFGEAMTEILAGKSVTKFEWDNTDYYGLLADNRLRLHKPDGQLYEWILSKADLKGEDFVVL